MSALSGIDELIAACGGRVPVRLLISGADGSERDQGVLRRPFLVVGRSAQCDIQLEGSDVSHRHAYIQLLGDRIFCADLGSRTGVHWHDGKRPLSWVGLNEYLAIGQYGLRFDRVNQVGTAVGAEVVTPPARHRPEVSLRFLNARVNTDRSRQWRLRRSVTLLGHLSSCHIPLLDASVSRVHASLLRTPLGAWVIDLLGKGGVEVNGERVTLARLSDGDVLKIGRFWMAVEQTAVDESLQTDDHLRGLTASTLYVHANTERLHPTLHQLTARSVADTQQRASRDLTRPSHAAPGNALPNRAAQPPAEGLSEAFVLSLLNQSASMQQQMAAQQHQMMLLTMQMLSAMQGQHAKLIREELKVIQTLTREIQQIRATLAGQGSTSPLGDEHDPEHDSAQAILPLIPPTASNPPLVGKPRPAEPPVKGQAAIGSRPAKVALAKHTAVAGQPAGLDGDALQAHLADRLAELERKRSGYWQKITRVMMG